MRKEKFIYNTQTLRYEKVVEPLSTTLLRIFGFFCAALFTAFLFTLLAHRYFPSPREKALLQENQALVSELSKIERELGQIEGVMDKVRVRHDYAHRLIYGMRSVDDGIWEGGVGGHDKYKELREFKHSGQMLSAVMEKIDKVKHKIALQSESLDSVVTLAKAKEEMLASIPSIKPVRSDKLARDVKLLSGYGWRMHPIFKVPKFHYGIDFTAPRGTPIQATGAGKVVKAGYGSGYGNRVVIDHGYGYETLYGHMHQIDVKVGDIVKRGQRIGLVGSTGHSTAPHCHYEVLLNNEKVNPIQFVADGLSPEEYQEMVEAAESAGQSMD